MLPGGDLGTAGVQPAWLQGQRGIVHTWLGVVCAPHSLVGLLDHSERREKSRISTVRSCLHPSVTSQICVIIVTVPLACAGPCQVLGLQRECSGDGPAPRSPAQRREAGLGQRAVCARAAEGCEVTGYSVSSANSQEAGEEAQGPDGDHCMGSLRMERPGCQLSRT